MNCLVLDMLLWLELNNLSTILTSALSGRSNEISPVGWLVG